MAKHSARQKLTVLQSALIRLIRVYQWLFSLLLGHTCRFTPTCSAYAIESIHKHGVLKGCRLALHRLIRCHPWCAGGVDLVK